MITRVLSFLPLAFVALPLQGQVHVELVNGPDQDTVPLVVALREAVLASRSFVMDRDTTHARFVVLVIPGGGAHCGPHIARAIALIITQKGPNYRSSIEDYYVGTYEVGTEAEQARRLLVRLDESTRTR